MSDTERKKQRRPLSLDMWEGVDTFLGWGRWPVLADLHTLITGKE